MLNDGQQTRPNTIVTSRREVPYSCRDNRCCTKPYIPVNLAPRDTRLMLWEPLLFLFYGLTRRPHVARLPPRSTAELDLLILTPTKPIFLPQSHTITAITRDLISMNPTLSINTTITIIIGNKILPCWNLGIQYDSPMTKLLRIAIDIKRKERKRERRRLEGGREN